MADRWLIAEPTTNSRGERVPVHADLLDGWSGQILYVPSQLGEPFSGDMYGLRAYADTATLDNVESQSGVWSVRQGGDYPPGTVAEYLNQKFGESYTVAEWEEQFWTSAG